MPQVRRLRFAADTTRFVQMFGYFPVPHLRSARARLHGKPSPGRPAPSIPRPPPDSITLSGIHDRVGPNPDPRSWRRQEAAHLQGPGMLKKSGQGLLDRLFVGLDQRHRAGNPLTVTSIMFRPETCAVGRPRCLEQGQVRRQMGMGLVFGPETGQPVPDGNHQLIAPMVALDHIPVDSARRLSAILPVGPAASLPDNPDGRLPLRAYTGSRGDSTRNRYRKRTFTWR